MQKTRVIGRPTPHHDTSPPRRGRNPKSLASCMMIFFFFVYADPLAKTYGHLWMPSTPGVRDRRCRYRIFPARHTMHAKCIKIHHSAHGPGCGSLHTRPTRDMRTWMYARGGSSFIWRLTGRLNPPTGQKLAVTISCTHAYTFLNGQRSRLVQVFQNLFFVSIFS